MSKIKHGKSRTSEYLTWQNIRYGCTNPRYVIYETYKAAGITVCEEWEDFEQFYADMGNKPSKDHCLIRINPDGGFNPSNCMWGTPSQNNRNTHRRKDSFPIAQYRNGYLVKVWDSLRAAERDGGYTPYRIRECVRGKRETYNGCTWMKVDIPISPLQGQGDNDNDNEKER